MKKWGVLLWVVLSMGCDSKRREITALVEKWQEKEIVFPDSLEVKISGRDTLVDLSATRYKILNYIDTNGCTECRMKLFDWQQLKEEADSLKLDVQLVFVAYVKEFQILENLQKINRFDVPFFYDRRGKMNEANHFPEHPAFQTFLLDERNRVVLVGSPVGNEKMWGIYKKRMMQAEPASGK